jgi:putative polyhydroxyalkanoate system protein
MAHIHIERTHRLGLAQARDTAARWVSEAESTLDMRCSYEAGEHADQVLFSRPGVSGVFKLDGERFAIEAKLGFLLSAFKDRIEQEIQKNLDTLLGQADGKLAAGREP